MQKRASEVVGDFLTERRLFPLVENLYRTGGQYDFASTCISLGITGIRPKLGNKIISQVTPKDIQRLYDKLAQSGNLHTGAGLSGGTIYGIHGMLHEALQVRSTPW